MSSDMRDSETSSLDPYLESIANQCQQTAAAQISENTAVAMDELDATSARSSVVLLQLQGDKSS